MITLAWIKERVNVDPQTGCWLWTGTKDKDGYGIGQSQGERFRVVRKVIELTTGQMDKDHYALHCCDNPPCCNYNHLFYGTHRDNQIDAASKGRHRLQRNPDLQSGVKNPNCKLSPDQVAAIRASGLNSVELSSVFGVSSTHIRDIRKGLWWKSSTI